MSSGTSRFRTGSVSGPASLADRARLVVDDGQELQQLVIQESPLLCRQPDVDALVELVDVISTHPDHHRVYLLLRLIATSLFGESATHNESEEFGWARHYDVAVRVLVPYLREHPSEPELLNLLGVAYYELGVTSVARRLFEAVKELEPDHLQARRNLRACKERSKRGATATKVPASLTTFSSQLHSDAKSIADRATRLAPATVSLCMIVKDEEEMLPGCLEAIAPHVDEIIICDTGSTDSTRDIAAEFGATIVEFPWNGSFSDARNRALQEATCDWILYLDADEHLVDDDGKHIRELIRRSWVEGYHLIETHYTGELDMGGQTAHMPMRLFQHRPHYHWIGTIHEQVMHNMPSWAPDRFQNSPIRINHYGYLKSIIDERSKRDRNLELLLQQPDDNAFNQFNIGSEYGAMGEWDRARPYFERALDLSMPESGWQSQQFSPMLVMRLITARRACRDFPAALEMIDNALLWWPDCTDVVFERALIRYEQGDYAAVCQECETCVSMGDAPARYVAVQGKGSFQARVLWSHALRELSDREAAQYQLDQALLEAPHFLPTVLELADVMLAGHDPQFVGEHIEQRLGDRATSPSANLLLATAMYEAGHLEHADRYYNRVLEQAPTNSAALIALAELRLAQGRPDDALELSSRVGEGDPLVVRAARTRFLAAVVAGTIDQLDVPLRTITEASWIPMGERSMYTAWHARLTGGTALLPPDPAAVVQIAANLEALAKLQATDEFADLVPLLEQALPDERDRRLLLGGLYLRRHFADMAAEEFMACAQEFGPDPQSLTGLGKAATMKEMWEDAEVFLEESLKIDPSQPDAQKLLSLIRSRRAS